MNNKKLYRSRYENTIGGVCSGIAQYFGIESILIKAAFFLLIWTPTPIILVYLFLWIFMKKEPKIT